MFELLKLKDVLKICEMYFNLEWSQKKKQSVIKRKNKKTLIYINNSI